MEEGACTARDVPGRIDVDFIVLQHAKRQRQTHTHTHTHASISTHLADLNAHHTLDHHLWSTGMRNLLRHSLIRPTELPVDRDPRREIASRVRQVASAGRWMAREDGWIVMWDSREDGTMRNARWTVRRCRHDVSGGVPVSSCITRNE